MTDGDYIRVVIEKLVNTSWPDFNRLRDIANRLDDEDKARCTCTYTDVGRQADPVTQQEPQQLDQLPSNALRDLLTWAVDSFGPRSATATVYRDLLAAAERREQESSNENAARWCQVHGHT